MDEPTTAWERSMRPEPSVVFGLSHFAAELLGSLLVISSTLTLIGAVAFIGGGTSGGLSARLTGAAMAVVAVPVFRFGRYLIMEHSVSPRRWKDDGDGPNPPLELPPPPSPTLQERHVAARRSPRRRPMSARPGDRRSPGVKTGA